MATISHDFYCINCGKKGLPCQRNLGKLKEKFHRKKLYCPNCKEIVNHVEIRNEEEEKEFLEDFKNGKYLEEAKSSLDFSGSSWLW